jgi:type 1 fimbriae regulatory protein FimB/type 1 fimbriae regulatory protein FimE
MALSYMCAGSRMAPRAPIPFKATSCGHFAGYGVRAKPSPFLFVSERGTPFTAAGFARVIERAASRGLGLELKAHPHMLRHACGYALANKGHDTRAIQGWLGHRSITSTAVYTALAPNRFKDFWRE